jgi:hypothetical protein
LDAPRVLSPRPASSRRRIDFQIHSLTFMADHSFDG